MIPRQEAMLLFGLLTMLGLAWLVARLLRARRHGLSIRMQVFLALSITTVVANAVFGWIIVDRFRARTMIFTHRAALEDARVLRELVARSIEHVGVTIEQGTRLLRASRAQFSFTRSERDMRVQILDSKGQILFDSWSGSLLPSMFGPGDMENEVMAKRPEVVAALRGETDTVARVQKNNSIAAAVPIVVAGEIVGVARVTKSTFSVEDVLADIAPKVLLLSLMLTMAAAVAGAIIGRSLGNPIELLTQAAERIARGERQTALPDPRGREVRMLTSAFESMRRELEQRSAVESFTADLSHELKNPVASIQAASEVLEDAVDKDPEAAKRFSHHIAEASRRLDALMRDLLALARLEARGIGESKRAFRIDLAAQSVVERASVIARGRGLEISTKVDAELTVVGDETWVERAISNLLDNAIAFSPEGGVVALSIEEVGGLVDVVVSDSGPGLDKGVRDRAFERFVTSRHDAGGTGLGLALVRAVAEAHGGTASIRATGPGGTSVGFTLRRV